MHALIKDGRAVRYPYSPTDLIRDNPNTSFPRGPLADVLLQEWGVVPVQETVPPEHNPLTHEVVELDPVQKDGAWARNWAVSPLTVGRQAAAQASLVAQYTDALTAHLDAVAQQRRYDNRITCALRAGYPGPFRAEGQAFAEWMDGCNAVGYQILTQVQSGQRALPSVAEFLAMLPEMQWPS